MSDKELYVIWAENKKKAKARLEQIVDGGEYRVQRKGDFAIIKAEDVDSGEGFTNGPESYCFVFELL